jgi:hypothetical protein
MIDVLRFVVGLVADVVRRAATQRGPHSARHASKYGSNALAIARPAPRGVLIVGPGAARGARGNRLSAALRGQLG